MRINYLETLIRVIETGSITETAKELFISQPAVTKQIKALESYYLVKIFNRNGNRIVPTKEGEMLYTFASKVVNYDQGLRMSFCEQEALVEGDLEIIGSNLPSYQFIPSLLSNYLKEFPGVRPHIETMTSDDVIDRVNRGVVAFGFTGLLKEMPGLTYSKLFEEEMVLVGNRTFIGVNHVDELKNFKFAVRERGSASLKSFKEYLTDFEIELNNDNTLFVCSDNEMLKRTLLQNDVVGYIPRCSIQTEIERGNVVVLDVGEVRDFYYVYNLETHMCNKRKSFHQYVMKHY